MEEINEETILQYKKKNQKIMLFYRMISFDFLVYYAISQLFLVNVKGLTTAQVLLADSFYPFFKFLYEIPCTILIQKIGKRNSLIFANSCLAVYILMVIGLVNISTLIIANLFSSMRICNKRTCRL